MHRVHHSIVRRETNSNFGFNLPWWDRLFGTYGEPAAGHEGMTIGIRSSEDRASFASIACCCSRFAAPDGRWTVHRRLRHDREWVAFPCNRFHAGDSSLSSQSAGPNQPGQHIRATEGH